MISQQFSVIVLILGESLCPCLPSPSSKSEDGWQIIRENPRNPRLLDMQNKPIFSILRIIASDLFIRTKGYRKRTDQTQNKPIQTHSNPFFQTRSFRASAEESI